MKSGKFLKNMLKFGESVKIFQKVWKTEKFGKVWKVENLVSF